MEKSDEQQKNVHTTLVVALNYSLLIAIAIDQSSFMIIGHHLSLARKYKFRYFQRLLNAKQINFPFKMSIRSIL